MIKSHTCFTIYCDGCGESPDIDGMRPHYDSQHEAVDEVADNFEWTVTRSGQAFCTAVACQAKAPGCVCPDEDLCDDTDCVASCRCERHGEVAS